MSRFVLYIQEREAGKSMYKITTCGLALLFDGLSSVLLLDNLSKNHDESMRMHGTSGVDPRDQELRNPLNEPCAIAKHT